MGAGGGRLLLGEDVLRYFVGLLRGRRIEPIQAGRHLFAKAVYFINNKRHMIVSCDVVTLIIHESDIYLKCYFSVTSGWKTVEKSLLKNGGNGVFC
jgi:hypothetical protein